ncbi:MAG: type I-C CRISPR-associated protein Cas7/Csd2 [Desulfamplus sp.]|nr:type I-C CRISPR-associated protein Cas7/Csd2 [Desulfamplus sp.]
MNKAENSNNNPVTNRYDFVMIFDVKDGNPNGDPDAGNLPRIDPETGMGLVTDVCLKRKIRNYMTLISIDKDKFDSNKYDIYVKEKAVLGRAHVEAFQALNITLGEESKKLIPENILNLLEDFDLPDGLTIEQGGTEDIQNLVIAFDADVKEIKEYLNETKPDPKVKKFITDSLKGIKSRRPTAAETEQGREYMCKRFFDIRTFGGVLSLKSAPNCGQVRGPVQFTFGRSVEPIVALEHSITRMAVATEKEAEKQQGDNRTMGRKFTVPYGVYRAHGFISPHLASQTGFDQSDLNLLWEAIGNMFEHDHSAARGEMNLRKLIVFKHDSALGNAPAHKLFDLVEIKRAGSFDAPARQWADYEVLIDRDKLPKGVTIEEKI